MSADLPQALAVRGDQEVATVRGDVEVDRGSGRLPGADPDPAARPGEWRGEDAHVGADDQLAAPDDRTGSRCVRQVAADVGPRLATVQGDEHVAHAGVRNP